MLKALLLDLDGTLIDLDGDQFLESYIERVAQWMRPFVDPDEFARAVWVAAIPVMAKEHPHQSNRQVLWQALEQELSVPAPILEQHLSVELRRQNLVSISPGGQPMQGARELTSLGQSLGLKLALATMPIYPEIVVRERLRRGGLDNFGWDFIATEEMHAVKPQEQYWEAIMAAVGARPDECLIVGDDFFRDIRQAPPGASTYYVGNRYPGLDPGPSGTLSDLVRQLERDYAAHQGPR